jgi:hypothetical protein
VEGKEQEFRLAELAMLAIKEWIVLVSRYETSPFYLGYGDLSDVRSFSEYSEKLMLERVKSIASLCEIQTNIEEEVLVSARLTKNEIEALTQTIGEVLDAYSENISDDVANIINRLWNLSEKDLINEVKADLGARRQLVKKSYFSDRRLELISHCTRVKPKSIIEFIKDQKVITKVEREENAESLISFLLGCAFSRWKYVDINSIRQQMLEKNPFLNLEITQPCAESNNSKDVVRLLAVDVTSLHSHGSLIDSLRIQLGFIFPNAQNIEEELLNTLGMKTLSEYFIQSAKFFATHLRVYSESRRQAPIYWPLSTVSGNYTLWVYYPALSSQTIYSAINDFVEPRLNEVSVEVGSLRSKGSSRTIEDEKQYELLQSFELELIELRDTLIKIAPSYKPNHDDGVQITAAPLWPLFRHKPWQKILKDVWSKLECGEYDWAHLALNYWPERVRDKCTHDKSLAIAHKLESLYLESTGLVKKVSRNTKIESDV